MKSSQACKLTLCILTYGLGPKHVSQTMGKSLRSHPSASGSENSLCAILSGEPRSGASFQHGCVLQAKLSVPRAKLRTRVTPRPLRRFNDAYGGCCALVQVLEPVTKTGDRRQHRQPATGRLSPQAWPEPYGLLTRLLQLYKQQTAVCSSRGRLAKGRRMSRAVLPHCGNFCVNPFTDATTS